VLLYCGNIECVRENVGLWRCGDTECVSIKCVSIECVSIECVSIECYDIECVSIECVSIECVSIECDRENVVLLYCGHIECGVVVLWSYRMWCCCTVVIL